MSPLVASTSYYLKGPFSEFGANLPFKAYYSFCGQKLFLD